MSLPHVLLGLLAELPRTGYELERVMREELDPIWRAELSQIYPALARLRRSGFVVLRVLGPRRGPRRNLYRATAAGRRELKRWIGEPASNIRGKDEVLARVAFLEFLPTAERQEAIWRQERILTDEISRLRSATAPRGFRQEARHGVVEKLEATRRFLRGLSQKSAGPSPTVPGPKVMASKKK
jgi:DNA-binding PadR family transcriptional regulator